MDIVKDPKIDWLGLKWIFVAASLLLALAGGASFASQGLNLGIDFTGGTLVFVKFAEEPRVDRIRQALSRAGISAEQVIRFDDPSLNQVQIRIGQVESEALEDLSLESAGVFEALKAEYGQAGAGKLDLNNVSRDELSARVQELDPDGQREQLSVGEFADHYDALAGRIVDHRNSSGGLIGDFAALNQLALPAAVQSAIQENFVLGSFTVISVESVGPKVGGELRTRARDAVLVSLLVMLGYIAFRFKGWIYGIAAMVALFHDVLITLGAFSVFQKEISLTVVGAVLTLVGYSINDTIVVFDRVRENLRIMRRADFYTVVNASINQTLNRTIMTSGMTFLAVMALYLLGGQVLNGFSFALVIGIIVGTYSSIAIASPIVLWWKSNSEKSRARA